MNIKLWLISHKVQPLDELVVLDVVLETLLYYFFVAYFMGMWILSATRHKERYEWVVLHLGHS